MNLITVEKSDVIEECIERFYPFTFGIESKGLKKAVEKAVATLNDAIYLPRHNEYPIAKIITLQAVESVVTRVSFNAPELQRDFYQPYPNYISDVNSFSDTDIMFFRGRASMSKQVRGISKRWEQVLNKLYLEDPPEGSTVTHIEYLPLLDKSLRVWELFPLEREFLEDLAFAIAKIREGRFLSYGKYLEAEVNADDLLDEGKEERTELIEKFRQSSTFLIGNKS